MIRINLLPVRQAKKAQAGQRQLLIFLLALVGELALLFLLFQHQAGILDDKQRQADELKRQIAALRETVGDFDQLKALHEQLLAQERTINELQKARTGPVKMLRELTDILTPGKGPTIDQDSYEVLLRNNPNAGYNTRWNPLRLWLESLADTEGQLFIKGKARDYDDVAEFNKRLALSRIFSEDFLERNDLVEEPGLGQKLVKFSLRCKAAY